MAAGGVCKVHAQDRIQQRLWSRTLTFQFLMVMVDGSVMEAVKVSPRDRVQQRSVEQISLTFQFRVVEVLTDQVLLLHPRAHLGAGFNPWTPAAHGDSMALEEDELESESEVEEEDAETRFEAAFRPLRVCMHMGRPVRGCAYGDRCTFVHSWAELHPEASAHDHELASY